ncbi:hypothetical protein CBM2599_B30245 [Cupriavidus taiwanensis]|uniref:Uncharacterized protein n=1 Tax=Cupriavidus taiwanensis TaxID=164546 RepID=A0A375D8X7_9BURK|nr:hypothetical protein CBM2599_B30245 [Cupriavidus taiwanensis]SOY99123.1 hypothetical protein CBM2600_B40085 [Cupriavidus taiwanensis]SPD67072.1 protein of unknown function [Cupriavidus taiwanensis]
MGSKRRSEGRATMQDARRTGRAGVARGAPVEGGPVPWHRLPISGRRARSGPGQRPEHQVARRGYRAWCNSMGGLWLVIPI